MADIDASAATARAALTEAERLAGWWSTSVESPAAAVGTKVEFAFEGDFNPVMEISAIEAGQVLSWRCISGHAAVAGQHVPVPAGPETGAHPPAILAGLRRRAR